MRNQIQTFYLLALSLPAVGQAFVIPQRPQLHHAPDVLLEQSSKRPNNNPEEKKRLWTRAVDTIKSWLPHRQTDNEQAIELRHGDLVTKKRDEIMPWPFPDFGLQLSRSVHRELKQEKHKSKPLFRDARRLILADSDARAALGEPIEFGPIFSHSSSTRTVNGRKSVSIKDSFEVEGSQS